MAGLTQCQRCATSVPSARYWDSLECISRPVLYPSDGEILDVFFTLTDLASTIPTKTHGCQSGTSEGTAEPVSRDQILRRERGQGNIHFPCSADHEQDWQPYPVAPHSCYV